MLIVDWATFSFLTLWMLHCLRRENMKEHRNWHNLMQMKSIFWRSENCTLKYGSTEIALAEMLPKKLSFKPTKLSVNCNGNARTEKLMRVKFMLHTLNSYSVCVRVCENLHYILVFAKRKLFLDFLVFSFGGWVSFIRYSRQMLLENFQVFTHTCVYQPDW